MGTAYDPPDSLMESYVEEGSRGCVAHLDPTSQTGPHSGSSDLHYKALRFNLRADPEPSFTGQMKV